MTILTVLSAVLDGLAVAGAFTLNAEAAPGERSTIVAMVAVVFAAVLVGLKDRRRLLAPVEELRRLVKGVSAGAVGIVLVSFALHVEVSRGWVVALWATSTATVGLSRLIARATIKSLNSRRVLGRATLVVGTNDEARIIARILERQPWRGYHVAGFVSVGPLATARLDGHAVVGTTAQVADAVARHEAGVVIIAGTATPPAELLELTRVLELLDVEVRISPGLPHVAASRMTVAAMDGLAMLCLRKPQFTRFQSRVKRSFDLVVASILAVILAPVALVIAMAVWFSSGRPVIFRQLRVGAGGKLFTIYKFRTMVPDAELRLDEVLGQNQADGLLFKLHDDPRVTRLGRVLRRWGLDELPQLVNVLKGNMSMVGPRPALLTETTSYDERMRSRLRVLPGLTGLWQVNGRHELLFDDYIRYDLYYVDNWSLGLDLWVIAKTIPALLTRRGSH
ncbi:MAG TPA: sugar transferase [Acidimicrobiales bacterium]|nr:sugar transferase [Acidimicrobiales bacterium]